MPFTLPFTNIRIGRNAPASQSRAVSAMPYVLQKSGLFSSITPRPDMSAFYDAYEKNGDVQACVRELRQTVGLSGWHLKQGEDDAPEGATDELNQVLNYGSSFREKRERTVRDGAVTGNAFWYLIGNATGNRILGIKPLDPRTMSLVATPHGEVRAYIQRVGMYSAVFTPAEIIHLRYDADPNNELLGFSPLFGVDTDIKADLFAAMTNKKAMENNATPSAVYILRDDLTGQEQIEFAIEQIRKQFAGPENAGKSAVLPDVKDIKLFERDFTKYQMLDMRRFNTEKVCAALGVPKFLLGYTETTNNNNGVELMKKFYTGTILPWEQLIAETITRELLPRLGGEQFAFEFLPQVIDDAAIKRLAMEEFKTGTMTLRQYKQEVGRQITPEDEQNPNFDAYILHAGGSARLLEDVGVEPVDTASPEAQENLLKLLQEA